MAQAIHDVYCGIAADRAPLGAVTVATGRTSGHLRGSRHPGVDPDRTQATADRVS
jgi:hypothetical protein